MCPALDRRNTVGTRAFFALADLELNLLVLVEGGIAACLDLRMMHKQIGAAVVGANKSVTLARIKPFYCTCTHCILLGPKQATKLYPSLFELKEAYS